MTRKKFSSRKIFITLAACSVILSTVACGSPMATEEAPSATTSIAPSAEPVQTPGDPSTTDTTPAIPETRRLTLEYPFQLKAGAESDLVRLTLEVDDLGNITPTAVLDGSVVEGEIIEIPNLYETHNVTAEAEFDIAGLEVKPPGATFQALQQGESVTFFWSIRAQDVGRYRGTIWLHLVFTNRSTGEVSRMAVSAQIVEIEAVDFFGFSTNFVRTSGLVGSVLGVIVGFPFFDDIVKYLWGRFTKRRKKSGRSSR